MKEELLRWDTECRKYLKDRVVRWNGADNDLLVVFYTVAPPHYKPFWESFALTVSPPLGAVLGVLEAIPRVKQFVVRIQRDSWEVSLVADHKRVEGFQCHYRWREEKRLEGSWPVGALDGLVLPDD